VQNKKLVWSDCTEKICLGRYSWFDFVFKIILSRMLRFHPANKLTDDISQQDLQYDFKHRDNKIG